VIIQNIKIKLGNKDILLKDIKKMKIGIIHYLLDTGQREFYGIRKQLLNH